MSKDTTSPSIDVKSDSWKNYEAVTFCSADTYLDMLNDYGKMKIEIEDLKKEIESLKNKIKILEDLLRNPYIWNDNIKFGGGYHSGIPHSG
jgi:hypothetical protein